MAAVLFALERTARFGTCVCVCLLCWSNSASAVSHVIHVSIDGLRGDLLQSNISTSPGAYPNFKRFLSEGATTFNARTDYTYTKTLPDHASILTGRPVEQPFGATNTIHHGYTDNGELSSSSTLHNSGNPNLTYIASTFDVVHDNGLSTAFYASELKFSLFEQSYTATTGAPDLTGIDNGRDKIDAHIIADELIFAEDDLVSLTHTSFLSGLADDRYNYSFLHYDFPDSVGHSSGWGSQSWNGAVEIIDGYLGDIFELVETDVVLVGDTIIILTADHGGSGTKHDDATVEANYTVPVLVWGVGVAPGADLYSLNPISRLDPGTGRPSYTASGQPIRNGGTGNLAISLLGLEPVNGSTINGDHDLVVASLFAADFDANQAVNERDLNIWQTGYALTAGATKADGDSTLDGKVDGTDFLIWQREFGSSFVNLATAIPEPQSMVLVIIVLVCLQPTRMRRSEHPNIHRER